MLKLTCNEAHGVCVDISFILQCDITLAMVVDFLDVNQVAGAPELTINTHCSLPAGFEVLGSLEVP